MRLAGTVQTNRRRTFNVSPAQPLGSWKSCSCTKRSTLRLECRVGPLYAKCAWDEANLIANRTARPRP
eukprot:3408069-Lingulodinium_polyedra.AAC.1